MSHDQRPAKMRIVKADPPVRRKDDSAPPDLALPEAPATAKGPGLVEILLFLIACAGGGFGAVALMRSLGGS